MLVLGWWVDVGRMVEGMGRWVGVEDDGEEGRDIPGVRNDYVVEWGVAFAEAGEADFDDHVRGALCVRGGREW